MKASAEVLVYSMVTEPVLIIVNRRVTGPNVSSSGGSITGSGRGVSQDTTMSIAPSDQVTLIKPFVGPLRDVRLTVAVITTFDTTTTEEVLICIQPSSVVLLQSMANPLAFSIVYIREVFVCQKSRVPGMMRIFCSGSGAIHKRLVL